MTRDIIPNSREPNKVTGSAGRKQHYLFLFAVPALVIIFIFNLYPGFIYIPAAFKNWIPPQSISEASWVGIKWFKEILQYYGLPELLRNTLIIGIFDIMLCPIPLVLALASHHCDLPWLKKSLDVIIMIPLFIPAIVIVAMVQKILSTEGLLNQLLGIFKIPAQNHLLNGKLFYVYFSLSNLWSGMGFMYLTYKSCLCSSSRELHSAAKLDGASLLKRIIYIDSPLCFSSFLSNLVLQIGSILCTNTERLLLFKTTANSAYSSTLDLYAYELNFRSSFMQSQSKGIALSLFTMMINIILIIIARRQARKVENVYA